MGTPLDGIDVPRRVVEHHLKKAAVFGISDLVMQKQIVYTISERRMPCR